MCDGSFQPAELLAAADRQRRCRHTMTPRPGTYVLILRSDDRKTLQIGKRGPLDIAPGYYVYVGSALGPGGVLARVSRHCRSVISKHWHIDYLRAHTALVSVWFCYSPVRLEHAWAGLVATLRGTRPVTRFGCSDCDCATHLYFLSREPELSEFTDAARVPVKVWSCEGSG